MVSRAIGVLISVYHAEDPKLFRRAIESILNQELPSDIELRVYLGVDGPVPIALTHEIQTMEPRLHRVAWFEHNRGLVHVLNDLIRMAQDETYLFRMDTDDVSHPLRFARQIAFMDTHPEIDILGTAITEVDTETGARRIVRYAPSPEAARRDIGRRVPIAHATACFRRTVFDRLGGYPAVPLNEDIAFWFECLKAGLAFANIHEPLYECTVSPNFWGRRSFKKAWSEFRVYTRGIWELHGPSWEFVFPLARLCLRLAPTSLQRLAYSSRLRRVESVA
ncbi:glycosyltransferase [Pedomonas sp. V897]|uniref:glycosyltransferase n=1 Tax=Pedomonas sp. V897 TaxID=3446482 RepID=UPI003EDED58D